MLRNLVRFKICAWSSTDLDVFLLDGRSNFSVIAFVRSHFELLRIHYTIYYGANSPHLWISTYMTKQIIAQTTFRNDQTVIRLFRMVSLWIVYWIRFLELTIRFWISLKKALSNLDLSPVRWLVRHMISNSAESGTEPAKGLCHLCAKSVRIRDGAILPYRSLCLCIDWGCVIEWYSRKCDSYTICAKWALHSDNR